MRAVLRLWVLIAPVFNRMILSSAGSHGFSVIRRKIPTLKLFSPVDTQNRIIFWGLRAVVGGVSFAHPASQYS